MLLVWCIFTYTICICTCSVIVGMLDEWHSQGNVMFVVITGPLGWIWLSLIRRIFTFRLRLPCSFLIVPVNASSCIKPFHFQRRHPLGDTGQDMATPSSSSTRGVAPRGSVESTPRDQLSEGEVDPLSDGAPRSSSEVGLETIRPPPPPPDEVSVIQSGHASPAFAQRLPVCCSCTGLGCLHIVA